MKKITIEIETENAAFQHGYMTSEVSRILRDLATEISYGNLPKQLRDINGNTVGHIKIEN